MEARSALFGALAAVLLSGCGGKPEETAVAAPEPVLELARVGGGFVTEEELRASLAARPPGAAPGGFAAAVGQRLDELIREESLAQEALRLELDRDPETARRIRQLLIGELLRKRVERQAWSRPVEEAEVEAYYEEHRGEFDRPDQVRVADIFITAPEELPAEQREERRERAERVLAEALEVSRRRSGFGDLVGRYSDTPAQYPRGDTGFFGADGMPAGVHPNLAAAAFRLERNGQVGERVVETPMGFHVIMRTGKRSAVNVPMEQVRAAVERELRERRLREERQAYVEDVRRGAEVRIDEQQLSRIAEDLASEAEVTAQGPRQGTSGAPTRPPR